jgi:hypothetical protein
MNKAQWRELGKYVRSIADEMGLKDWKFRLCEDEPETPDEHKGTDVYAQASCTPTPGQRMAVLRFTSDFNKMPKDQVRAIVTHELLHCHLAAIYEFGRVGLMNELGQSAYNTFMFGFTQAWEQTIDSIAQAWAVNFPLIKWPV